MSKKSTVLPYDPDIIKAAQIKLRIAQTTTDGSLPFAERLEYAEDGVRMSRSELTRAWDEDPGSQETFDTFRKEVNEVESIVERIQEEAMAARDDVVVGPGETSMEVVGDKEEEVDTEDLVAFKETSMEPVCQYNSKALALAKNSARTESTTEKPPIDTTPLSDLTVAEVVELGRKIDLAMKTRKAINFIRKEVPAWEIVLGAADVMAETLKYGEDHRPRILKLAVMIKMTLEHECRISQETTEGHAPNIER